MLLPQPNVTYRVSRRHDLEGFERFLEASIELVESPTPVQPMRSTPSSLEDLAGLTASSTSGAYRLALYSDEVSSTTLILPWEVYAHEKGDIFVFGPNVKSQVGLAERTGHRSYRPSSHRAIAASGEPLGFLYYHGNELFETIEGDLCIVKPERLRVVARAVVRPVRMIERTLN